MLAPLNRSCSLLAPIDLLVVGMALALVISGGGKWSLDRVLARRQHGE